MIDEKKIEEMAKVLHDRIVNKTWRASKVAKELYSIAVPEGAVVLTREELFRDSTQLSKEKQIETIHNIILENLDYGYEETARAIYDANYRKIPKLGVILPFDHYDNLLKTDKEVRKETAKAIIDMLIPSCEVCDENWHKGCLCLRATIAEKIAKQYGVEVEE